jgi:hypothetical protein
MQGWRFYSYSRYLSSFIEINRLCKYKQFLNETRQTLEVEFSFNVQCSFQFNICFIWKRPAFPNTIYDARLPWMVGNKSCHKILNSPKMQ